MKSFHAQILFFGCLFLSIFLITNPTFGQNKNLLKIVGYVRDVKTQKPLEGISVIIRQTQKGVKTDRNGYYTIYVAPGYYVIAYTSVGHRLRVREINPVQIDYDTGFTGKKIWFNIRIFNIPFLTGLREMMIMNPSLDRTIIGGRFTPIWKPKEGKYILFRT
jgi:hypothetical protein